MLRNPQDQLSKTLTYNSDPYAFARHVQPQHPSMDTRHPNNHEAHHLSAHTTKPARPMVTPTASFRGAMDWGHTARPADPTEEEGAGYTGTTEQHQPDTCMETSQPAPSSEHQYIPPVTASNVPRMDDYSAFEQDAFAPLNPPSFAAQTTNGSADPWAVFRLKAPPPTTSHSFDQQDRSHVVNQPAPYQTYPNNAQQRY